MINERISALRKEMEKEGIDIYYVPTADFHESEYVGEYFKARKFITGFTGSAGVAVITKDEALLWTDGRYFIQAEKQLADSEVKLCRMGEEGVLTVKEYIGQVMKSGQCIGFDGRVVNATLGNELQKIAEAHDGTLLVSLDLIDRIWADRPSLSAKPAYILDTAYAGETAADKIMRVRTVMQEKGADVHILTSLDDIAWLLNIRGNDARHFPIVLSFLIVTQDEVRLYVNPQVIDAAVSTTLADAGVRCYPYEQIYSDAADITAGKSVLLDLSRTNYRIYHALSADAKRIAEQNPTVLMKSIKNEVELENIKNAHLQDGIAVTKFLYWLKNNVGKIPMTEITASDYLTERRMEREGYLDISFDTISAYEANGAMMHYSATKEQCAQLKPEGFLLVDSGGHYRTGSTDITRTIALGALSQKQKEHFTIVLRSMLNLSSAKFLYGCRGINLDILARGPLWDLGLDYRCGTGHGVGYLLNIHEGPNGFRWKMVSDRLDSAVLEEGMVTTDEPGVYLEGEYGIRTENELICRKAEKTEYGQFMCFETITYAPIDLDAVIPENMSPKEKELLNAYHQMVYDKIAPHLTVDEADWLKEYTREI